VNLYVGNLPYGVTDADLRQMFEKFGAVERAQVVTDRFTGKSRGYGFVEMPAGEQARAAIEALHGSSCGGRTLRVNEARPRDASENASSE